MSFRFDLDRIERRRLVPGLILIAIGVLGLFAGFGWLRGLSGLVGAALFGVAAYYAYLQGRHTGQLLWRVGAFPLAGLAIASIAPGPLGGFAFLGSIGAAFTLVYLDDADRWWAVIPAGALYSMAVTALVDGAGRAAGAGGSVFLFGLAATFFVLTRLPKHAQPWAVFPAAGLAILAMVALTTAGGWIVPLLLIAGGVWMLMRAGGADALRSAVRSGPLAGRQPAEPPQPPVVATPPAAPAPGVTPEAPPKSPAAPEAPPAAPEGPATGEEPRND